MTRLIPFLATARQGRLHFWLIPGSPLFLGRAFMHRTVSRSASAVSCLLLLLLCGCTRKWDEAGTTHYSFELWVAIVSLLGCMASIPAGWLLRAISERLGYGILIAGVAGLVLLAPSLFTDHVTLNDEGFTLRTGLWMAPTLHDVKFRELSAIELTSKTCLLYTSDAADE